MTAAVADPVSGLPIGPETDGRPARRPDRSVALEGRHVRLVAIDPARHADALYDASHGPGHEALWLYLFPPPFPDRAAFRAHLDKAAALDDPFMYAILDARDGEPLGHATFMRIDPAHRAIEVGNILYTPRLQRTPGATEAMYLMARHAFEELGFRRYEWKCNALNAPSRRAAERYGFVPEGVFRSHMIVKGRSRDTAWYAMLDSEWPARRRAFERWLDPAHFDAAGRQRWSLAALNARELHSDGDTLRRAGPDDAEALDRLQHRAYGPNRALLGAEPVPLLTPAADVLAHYETWLLDDDGELAGVLVLEPHPDHLLVWSVATDPARQGRGLGRKLLAAAEARARALGLDTLRLYTGEPLVRNIDWYRRRGYETDRVEALPDRRLVHMAKRLGR